MQNTNRILNFQRAALGLLLLGGQLCANPLAYPTTAQPAANPETPPGLDEAIRRAALDLDYDAVWQVGTPLPGIASAYQAPNHAQDMRTWFLDDEVTIVPRRFGVGDWSLGMGLHSVTRGAESRLTPATKLTTEGERACYSRGGIVEWFENSESGLEQGFDIESRPFASEAGALELLIDLTGSLRLDSVGRSQVGFDDVEDRRVLTFGGLKSFDSTGRLLPSRFERRGEDLAVIVDDQDAVYPITVDPTVINEAYQPEIGLGSGGIEFGLSVAVDGSHALVGSDGFGSSSGLVFAFERVAGEWVLDSKLGSPNATLAARFGAAIDIDGDTAVIGASRDSVDASMSGSVYVFERIHGKWVETDRLGSPTQELSQWFGTSVSIDGDWIAAGAPVADAPLDGSGSVHLFKRFGQTWSHFQTLQSLVPSVYGNFGEAVCLSGGELAVGEPRFPSATGGQGLVTIWKHTLLPTESWGSPGLLVEANASGFGKSIDFVQDHIVVGAPDTAAPASFSGAAFVYERVGSNFLKVAEMSGSAENDRLGTQVALSLAGSSPMAFIACPGRDVAANNSGGVAVLRESAGTWQLSQWLEDPGSTPTAYHGRSLATDGANLFIGAPLANSGGQVLSFRLAGSSWDYEDRYQPTAPTAGEGLGYSLATYTNRAVVGIPYDSDSMESAGMVAVFKLEDEGWVFSTRLSAGYNTQKYAAFGSSVASTYSYIVVGAPYQPSSKGAAYVFKFSGGQWELFDHTAPPVGTPMSGYGLSVTISGDFMAVGAPDDDNFGTNTGAVYTYERVDDDFDSLATLYNMSPTLLDRFGAAVAIWNNHLTVGIPGEDIQGFNNGMIRNYIRLNGSWVENFPMFHADDASGALFGSSLAGFSDRVIVGAPGDHAGAGLAVSYKRVGYDLIPETVFTASDAVPGDEFGFSVGIWEDAAVIGAPGSDAAGFNAGAAYAYQLEGATWTETKCTASDAGSEDRFGHSVGILGDQVLVGAPYADRYFQDSGALYAFELSAPETFTAFGFGDGSVAPCPCGNESVVGSGQGCKNSTGVGAKLIGLGTSSIAADDMVLRGEGLRPGAFALLFKGDQQVAPIQFGDGLLLAGPPIVRLEVGVPDAAGVHEWDHLHAGGNWAAGDTGTFQVWYRDPNTSPCGNSFNVSSALRVEFQD